MDDLYIVGAGGFGREVLLLLRQMEAINGARWTIKGFLDDVRKDFGQAPCELPIVGSIHDFYPGPSDRLALAVADPGGKMKLVGLLKPRGAVFVTLIHPWAVIGSHCHVGEGSILQSGFSMTVNARVGNYCSLLACTLGHDVQVGDFTTISSYTHVMGNANIGDGVFIGGNAAIAPKVAIGNGAHVCLGSVVFKDVPPGAKVLGNPAREIG